MANDEKYSHDFIREIINKDLKTKKNLNQMDIYMLVMQSQFV